MSTELEEQHSKILEIIEVQDEFCSDWERTFLASVSDWTRTTLLTPKQRAIVDRLYIKACNLPEHRAKVRQPKKPSPKPKPKRRTLSPDEAWQQAPTPQKGDEEILF